MSWRYLTLILTVLMAAALTVAVGAAVFGGGDSGGGAGLPAWALVVPLALAILLRKVAR